MASKQTYPCFVCRKAGYEIPVYLDGKDAAGRTKYLNEDGTKHIHKTNEQQQQKQQQHIQEQDDNPLAPVSDESVQRGISAFTMMTDLIILVEQTQKKIIAMDDKLDTLLNQSQGQQK